MNELDIPDLAATKKPAIPRFFVEPVELTFRSKQEGRPIYEEREFVEILIPGDRRSIVREPVNDEHKARWPREYAAFKDGRELPLEGTPLANWPNSAINRARVEELAYFNIRTVEHLAAVSDANLPNLGMGARELRAAAQKFLEVAAKGTAPLERMVHENFQMKDDLVRKDRIIAEQAAEIARLRELTKESSHA
jgi:hypothetical protein